MAKVQSDTTRADGSHVLNSRSLAVVVGVLSLALGIFTLAADIPAMGLAAGAMGLVAGLLAIVASDHAHPAAPRVGDSRGDGAAADGAPATARVDPAGPPVGERRAPAPGPTAFPPPADPVVIDSDATAGAELLTDPDTNLFSEAYLRVALDSRLASARRHLRPVALALIEVTEGMPDELAVAAPADRVADAMRETIREADIACRMDDGTFAIILEDTPENGAVWTVERIRRNLVSRFGHHTLWAGVACYPAHAFDSTELMTQVRSALAAAKEWNQDRIEVAAAE